MKHKKGILLLLLLFVMVCTGCADDTDPQESQTEAYHQHSYALGQKEDQPVNQATDVSEAENPASYGELLEISTFSGVVTEFWETGCKLTPIHYEENVAYSAAPENETEWITVAYQDTCTFQIANVNAQTGTVTYKGASIQDIEKQLSLVICGEYDSSNVLHGERVFIYRSVR